MSEEEKSAVENPPVDGEHNLTDEQRLEHERQVRAQIAADRAAHEARAQVMEREIAEGKLLTAIENTANQIGVTFEPDSKTLLKLLQMEPDLDIRSESEVYISGQRSDLAVALDVFHRRHAHYVKESVRLVEEKKAAERHSHIKSLADLPTSRDRQQYISQYGLAAFENLVAGRVPSKSWTEMTSQEYGRLSRAEKVRIIGENGVDAVTRKIHDNDLRDTQRRERERREELRKR